MPIKPVNQSGARAYATDNKPSGPEDGNRAQAPGRARANSISSQSTPKFLRTLPQNQGISYYDANAVSNYSWRINPGGGCPSSFEMSQNVLARTDRNYTPEMAGFVALLKADDKARWEANRKQSEQVSNSQTEEPDGKCCCIC